MGLNHEILSYPYGHTFSKFLEDDIQCAPPRSLKVCLFDFGSMILQVVLAESGGGAVLGGFNPQGWIGGSLCSCLVLGEELYRQTKRQGVACVYHLLC